MIVFVFGNQDLDIDNMPLRIAPKLKKFFPDIQFEIKDPNEEWPIPENLIVLDTVVGINEVKIFDNLDEFSAAPRVGMHDFDALANLKFLQKLGKIKKIKIIGLPPGIDEKEVFKKAKKIFEKLE